MWIGKGLLTLMTKADAEKYALTIALTQAVAQFERVSIENARFIEERKWFMHRLNQVERERAQLILSATGTHIAIPEFTPTFPDVSAMDPMPDFTTIGNDAADSLVDLQPDTPDYSLLPGYKRSA